VSAPTREGMWRTSEVRWVDLAEGSGVQSEDGEEMVGLARHIDGEVRGVEMPRGGKNICKSIMYTCHPTK
jgi:hypothetical protein